MTIRDWLLRSLEEFGLTFARARSGGRGGVSDRRVEVYLAAGDSPLLVGVLREEQGLYVFEYADRFRAQESVPPISSFPDKRETYSSPELYPFFNVRIPPRERADVKAAMEKRGIQPHDVLRVIGDLSSRSPTSPYVFIYREDDARSSVPPRMVVERVMT